MSLIKIRPVKAILNFVAWLRYKLNFQKLRIPELAFDPQFSVALALRQDEFEGAFRLIHDDLVYKKMTRPSSSGLKLSLHHVMPQNFTITVNYKGMIAGTATLIQDSQLGFMSERSFATEIQALRRVHRAGLVELTNIVVDAAFRANQLAIIHLIMKFAINLCQKNLKARALMVTVNPALATYFQEGWGFTQRGPEIRPNSNPLSRVSLQVCDITGRGRREQLHQTPSRDRRWNVALFVKKRDRRFHYPKRSEGQRISTAMTAAMIEDFCLKKTHLYEELDQQARQTFLEMHLQLFGSAGLKSFLQTETVMNLKEFRLPVDTQVAIKCGEQFYVGAVRDISPSGCYVEMPQEIISAGQPVSLTFYLGETELKVDGKPIWRNKNANSKYREGYGFRFERPIMNLQQQISEWSTTNQKTRVSA